MADISSGKDDQKVEKAGSFKLFGKSSARNLSNKIANPLGGMFSLSRKKSEKQNAADVENSDISSTNDEDGGKQGEIDILATIHKTARETISEVTDQVARHANIETIEQHKISDDTDVESKESTPVIDEKKPKFFGKLLERAEKTKEELMEKAQQTKEGLMEKAEQPAEYFGKLREKAEKTKEDLIEKAQQTKEELLKKGNESLQGVFRVDCGSCLASLLQKICCPWSNKKED